MIRVYIASPRGNVRRAREIASELRVRAHEFDVISTWHANLPEGTVKDPEDPVVRRNIFRLNEEELGHADAVLAVTKEGEGRETYREIGRALACHKPVIWLLDEGGACLATEHPLVFPVHSITRAIGCLRIIARHPALRDLQSATYGKGT